MKKLVAPKQRREAKMGRRGRDRSERREGEMGRCGLMAWGKGEEQRKEEKKMKGRRVPMALVGGKWRKRWSKLGSQL